VKYQLPFSSRLSLPRSTHQANIERSCQESQHGALATSEEFSYQPSIRGLLVVATLDRLRTLNLPKQRSKLDTWSCLFLHAVRNVYIFLWHGVKDWSWLIWGNIVWTLDLKRQSRCDILEFYLGSSTMDAKKNQLIFLVWFFFCWKFCTKFSFQLCWSLFRVESMPLTFPWSDIHFKPV
jgi:hypothetical protein